MPDRYSGWNKTAFLTHGKCTMAELIKWLRAEFADMLVPEEISSDRGPNLIRSEMKEWLKCWGVKIRESSALFPQSNGRAECVVKAT